MPISLSPIGFKDQMPILMKVGRYFPLTGIPAGIVRFSSVHNDTKRFHFESLNIVNIVRGIFALTVGESIFILADLVYHVGLKILKFSENRQLQANIFYEDEEELNPNGKPEAKVEEKKSLLTDSLSFFKKTLKNQKVD
ncbi:MAG: hypothetical protein BGO10_03500 [Chlamydia sp. 32-24]|nr:MAG: hypothetical protein BGO10_03500 [Chlamydia sp. 32-24]